MLNSDLNLSFWNKPKLSSHKSKLSSMGVENYEKNCRTIDPMMGKNVPHPTLVSSIFLAIIDKYLFLC